MAFTLTKLVTSFQSVFQSHSGAIRNTTITLIVFGINAVVQSEDFFQCPPDGFALYASCFFIIPALFLFLVTIFLHSGFWDLVRGCCFYEQQQRRGLKRYCCCFFPRWPCSRKLVEIIFQSSLSGFIWIFWALLQRDYFICAALGGTKEAKLLSASPQEKLKIEADYANAGEKFTNSRFIAPRLFSARGFPCYFHPKMLFPARNRLIAKSFHLQNTRSRSSS